MRRNSRCTASTTSVPIASICGIFSGYITGKASCSRKKLNRMKARHSTKGLRKAKYAASGASPRAISTAGLGIT